jgi:hypothetical protein
MACKSSSKYRSCSAFGSGRKTSNKACFISGDGQVLHFIPRYGPLTSILHALVHVSAIKVFPECIAKQCKTSIALQCTTSHRGGCAHRQTKERRSDHLPVAGAGQEGPESGGGPARSCAQLARPGTPAPLAFKEVERLARHLRNPFARRQRADHRGTAGFARARQLNQACHTPRPRRPADVLPSCPSQTAGVKPAA